MKNKLSHCDVDEIDIYPPKSSGDENKYKSGKKLEEVIAELEKKGTPPTSDDHPLIVVAPDPKQANGEKCSRFGLFVHFLLNLFKLSLANN